MNPTEQQQAIKPVLKTDTAQKPKRPKQPVPTLDIKASMVNPAWAHEVVKAFELTGQVAAAVASDLEKAAEAATAKALPHDKLKKLIKVAFVRNIGNIGNQ